MRRVKTVEGREIEVTEDEKLREEMGSLNRPSEPEMKERTN